MKRFLSCFGFAVLFLSSSGSVAMSGNLSVPTDTGFIQVDGGRLYYEMAGKGETIVLIHDGILHRVVWDAQFPVLAKEYRVVRYDRRGFGKSVMPKAPFSHLDDLAQVFDQLKIDKAILFGMSAGGALAIDFTLKYPDKVNALVLVGAVVSGYPITSHTYTRGGRLASLDEVRNPQRFIEYFGWEDPYEIYPENVQAKEKFYSLLKANPQNFNGALCPLQKPPDRPALRYLSEIKVPVLILAGEFDIPDVHAHAGAIETGIPDAKRRIVPKAGHLIPLDQPEAFNAEMLEFLHSVEFHRILNSNGVEAAVRCFHKMRENSPELPLFEEGEMNALGYSFLQNGKTKEAIELFRLNTIAYPNSANTYDSLGEAYLKDGQRELAIKNYKKSLELNPNNTNAQQVLIELKKSK